MLEPELEALLLRIVPNLAHEWSGASPEEIEEIEDRFDVRGHEVPPFYRWFLSRLGGRVGALHPMLRGFTAASVLEAYHSGSVRLSRTQVLIGRMPDPLMPLDVYYDLTCPMRGDALVTTTVMESGPERNAAETFREWLAAGAFRGFRVLQAPHSCFGAFVDAGGGVAEQLDAVMSALGFTNPLSASGPYCRLYEREEVTMVAKSSVEPSSLGILVFDIGGPSVASIRRVFGEIGTKTSLQIDVDRWTSRPS
jgi:hypothetical protein